MKKRLLLEAYLDKISAITLLPEDCVEISRSLADLTKDELDDFLNILKDHHVTIRTLKPLLASDAPPLPWSDTGNQTIAEERERIRISLAFLSTICAELESAGARVVVFKTLDHWPDFGNDLDLFVIGDEHLINGVLASKFTAQGQVRSWGDHLAHKWSFRIPGCPADVELHINRLGQVGEHLQLARRFITRRQYFLAGGHSLPVPAPEERVIAATLQRMYRHLYFRICDIVNLATLLQNGELSWQELAIASDVAGIWPGVVGCLEIVVDYANRYLLEPLRLPAQLQSTRHWDSSKLHVQGRFLHIPFLPDGTSLFCRQLAHTLKRGDLDGTARLTLLPPLASVAALAYAVTGSNGRIW